MIRGRVQNGAVRVDPRDALPEGAEVRVELVELSQLPSAMTLLDRWLSDDSGYDEAACPELKTGLDQNRVSARRLFDGEADPA